MTICQDNSEGQAVYCMEVIDLQLIHMDGSSHLVLRAVRFGEGVDLAAGPGARVSFDIYNRKWCGIQG